MERYKNRHECAQLHDDCHYANALAGQVHDRMPVLLQQEDFARWLAGTADSDMLKPAPDDYLQVWPVSRRVNSSHAPSDDPTLIEQIAA